MPSKTSPQVAQAFHQAFGFDGIETIRADADRELEGHFGQRAVDNHVKIEISVPARPQSHSRAERFNQELENVVRTSLYQSGLLYTFWSEAVRMATENFKRTADFGETSPHEKRFGEISTVTFAPFGTGVRYLIEERPKGKKLAPRSAPGLTIGYATARSLRVLDLQLYVTNQTIKIFTTRDYRFVPGDLGPYTYPFVKVAGAHIPESDWSLDLAAPEAAADARGPLVMSADQLQTRRTWRIYVQLAMLSKAPCGD